GQPLRQYRVEIELSPRCVRLVAEYRLKEGKHRARRPGLGNVGPEILDRKAFLITLDRRIKLGQLIRQKVAGRVADIAGNPSKLGVEAVPFETKRDDGVVVRPDRSGLVVVRIERRVQRGERANAP